LKKAGINIHVLVKSLKRGISLIPANHGSGPGQAPESRVSCENRNPVSKMFPYFRRDDVWPPVSTGVTTFYEIINISIQFILFVLKDQVFVYTGNQTLDFRYQTFLCGHLIAFSFEQVGLMKELSEQMGHLQQKVKDLD